MKESYHEKIAPVVTQRWASAQATAAEDGVSSKKNLKAGFRAQVARDMFAALPRSEQAAIALRAKQEAADAKAAYLKAMKEPPSQSPEARQQ